MNSNLEARKVTENLELIERKANFFLENKMNLHGRGINQHTPSFTTLDGAM